jgi:hypothetical protein
VLAGVGGWIWWRGHQQEVAAGHGEELTSALDSLEAGNRNGARAKIDALAGSDIAGYRAAALFTRANSETAAGNAPAAIATLREIAGNQEYDELYRQAALVRQTQLEFDALPPQQVIQRLSPLIQEGSPWLGSAGEMVGIAYLKLRQPQQAGPIFRRIGLDENVPPSIRTRAVQMAGSLGFDATGEPAAAAGPAAPVRPVGPAQPAPATNAPPAPAAARGNSQ